MSKNYIDPIDFSKIDDSSIEGFEKRLKMFELVIQEKCIFNSLSFGLVSIFNDLTKEQQDLMYASTVSDVEVFLEAKASLKEMKEIAITAIDSQELSERALKAQEEMSSNIEGLRKASQNNLNISYEIQNNTLEILDNIDEVKDAVVSISDDVLIMHSDFSECLPERFLGIDELKSSLEEFSYEKINLILSDSREGIPENARHISYGGGPELVSAKEVSILLSDQGFSKIMSDYQHADTKKKVNEAASDIRLGIKKKLRGDSTRILTGAEIKEVVDGVNKSRSEGGIWGALKEDKVVQYAAQRLHQFQESDLSKEVERKLTAEISEVKEKIEAEARLKENSGSLFKRMISSLSFGSFGNKPSFDAGIASLADMENISGLLMNAANDKASDFFKNIAGQTNEKILQNFQDKTNALEMLIIYSKDAGSSRNSFQYRHLKSGLSLQSDEVKQIMSDAYSKAEKVLESDVYGLPEPDEKKIDDALVVIMQLSALSLPEAKSYLEGSKDFTPVISKRVYDYMEKHPELTDQIVIARENEVYRQSRIELSEMSGP